MVILGSGALAGGAIAVFNGEDDAGAAALVTVGALLVTFALVIPYVRTVKGGGFEFELGGWHDLTRNFQAADPIPVAGAVGREVEATTGSDEFDVSEAARSDLDFTPDVLDQVLLATWASHRGIFVGHDVNPVQQEPGRWEFAVFLTGSGPLDQVDYAEFYMGPGWGRRIFTAVPDERGQTGIVVRAYNHFLVLASVRFVDGSHLLLHHFCNLRSGERARRDPFLGMFDKGS
jgi:hypothetical protein